MIKLSMNLLVVAATLLSACAPSASASPLVGRWSSTMDVGSGRIQTFTEVFNANGTVDLTIAGSGSCVGTQSRTGELWSATSTTVTFSGTPTCLGSVTCDPGDASITTCTAQFSGPAGGGAYYTLSNGDMTLVLGGATFTRQ